MDDDRQRRSLVVMLPYDRLHGLCARHCRFAAHERRARAEAKGHRLPERVEERGADAVLLLNELHHGEVVAFGSPHALCQALARRRSGAAT